MFRITHLASDRTGKKFVSSAVGGKLAATSQTGTNSPQRSVCVGKLTLWDMDAMKAEVGSCWDYLYFQFVFNHETISSGINYICYDILATEHLYFYC